MSRTLWAAAIVSVGLAGLLGFTTQGQVAAQAVQRVLVTNFPDVQRIEGQVTITKPILLSQLKTFEDIIVPPVKPTDTTRLVEGGTLITEGFPDVVLSLHGQVKGSVHRQGAVGALLVPDEVGIQEAFNEQGLVHFAMEVSANGVSSLTPYFASNQPQFTVGFRSYKVLLYNTTDKTVTVDLFAYLTSS